MKKTKLKSQPKWVVRSFIIAGALLGGIFAFISHPIGGTNANYENFHVYEAMDGDINTLTICNPEGGISCLTMMDRNLGATEAGIGMKCVKPDIDFECSVAWKNNGYDSYSECEGEIIQTCGYDCVWEYCGQGDFGEFDSYEACESEQQSLENEFNECMKNNQGVHGNYYQWGNNHGFNPFSGFNTTCMRAVWDPSYNNYGYNGDLFVINSNFCENFSNGYDYRENDEHYGGLRGGVEDSAENNRGYNSETNTVSNVEGRQGPCPEGYHVPSVGEWNTVLDYWIKDNKDSGKELVEYGLIKNYCEYSEHCFREYYGYVSCDDYYDWVDVLCDEYDENVVGEFQESFNIPLAGYLDYNGKLLGSYGRFLSSSDNGYGSEYHYGLSLLGNTIGVVNDHSIYGGSLRCFKNSPIIPNTAIITFFDGDVEINSEETILGNTAKKFGSYEPNQKGGYFFDGRYDNPNFEGNEFDFDTIINGDISLYAKWKAFERENITICDPDDSSACITMMDRNLGATTAGAGCNFHCNEDGWSSWNYDSYESCVSDVDRYCWEKWGYSSESDCENSDEDTYRCSYKKYEYEYYDSPEDMCGGGDYQGFDSYQACEQEYNECMNNNEGVFGYHYQWGRNIGFDSMNESIPHTKLRAVWDPSYNNYGFVGSDLFIVGYYTVTVCYDDMGCFGDEIESADYWENDEHYDGLRGGAEDSTENNRGYNPETNTVSNVEGRQGPCPEGYHVPSAGEWNTVLDYWIKKNKSPEKKLVNEDGLIGGYCEEYSRHCYNEEILECYYDEDCVEYDEYWNCSEYEQVLDYCETEPVDVSCDGEYEYEERQCDEYDENFGGEFQESFNIPLAGYLENYGYLSNFYYDAMLWSSSPMSDGYSKIIHVQWNDANMYSSERVQGNSVRCFKNVADIPTQQNTGSTTTGSTTSGSTTEPTTGGGGGGAGGSQGGGAGGGAGGGGGGMVSNNKPTTQDPDTTIDPDTTVDGHNSAVEVEIDTTKFDTNYSDEMNEAYQYAHHYGITTKESVKEADMGGSLTRIAMAKMLSQYAINVLGQTPDTSKNNKFKDVSDQMDSEYNDGVTLAYQLGIMGINMPGNKFRPNDPVTRAEFVTALSRMKYNTPDGEDTYYSTHMKLLNRLGIITNTDPNMKELRGYVMLMLMRAK